MSFKDAYTEDKEFEKSLLKSKTTVERESFIKIPTEMLRNVVYQKWMGTSRSCVFWFLLGYAIRAKQNNPIANMIHKKYYLKKKIIASRFTHQGLAELLGYKDRRGINNCMSQLKKENVFKVHNEPWGNRIIKIYEFGKWKKIEGHYIEKYHIFTKFRKEEADAKVSKYFG